MKEYDQLIDKKSKNTAQMCFDKLRAPQSRGSGHYLLNQIKCEFKREKP